MKTQLAFAIFLLGACMVGRSGDPSSEAPVATPSASSPQPHKHTTRNPQKTPATGVATPSATTPRDQHNMGQIAPGTYHGAQGKKKDPGTACNSARLKKDGTLDCGMRGASATPGRPR